MAGNPFIVLNTNSVEFDYPIPDMAYLRQALQPSDEYQNTYVLSHVPPFDTDFDKMQLLSLRNSFVPTR